MSKEIQCPLCPGDEYYDSSEMEIASDGNLYCAKHAKIVNERDAQADK